MRMTLSVLGARWTRALAASERSAALASTDGVISVRSDDHPRPADAKPRTATRACPLCGACGGELILAREPWRLIRCAGCGLAYMPEIPTEEAIDTDFEWADSFARERYERWMRNPLARLWTFFVLFAKPSRERRALRQIRRHVRRGRMLDVGCGDGRLGMLALRYGFDPVGVELSPKMAAKARRRLGPERVLCGRLEDFPLAPESFDVIVTVSYLEHEPQPLPALRQMRGLLRPGGFCVHKTPNFDSLLRKALGARWSGFRWPEHVQYFSPATLSKLMQAAEYEPVETRANPLSDNFWIIARRPT